MVLFKRVKLPFFSIFLNRFLKCNVFSKHKPLKATLKEIKYNKVTRGSKSVCRSRAIFRTQ